MDHFGFRDKIRFRTEVTRVEPEGSRWRVHWRELETGEEGSGLYESVHGRERPPLGRPLAGAALPRARTRSPASRSTSTTTASPTSSLGKRVLVLGIGNSATDLAVEASRVADATFLAMRRGAWIIPKYIKGVPTDELAVRPRHRLPLPLLRTFYKRTLKTAVGHPTDFGLPEPDHKLAEAHPTISSDLLPRLGHGDITVKPNIAEFTGGRTVRFEDGSRRGDRPRHLLHGLQDHVPVLRPGPARRPDNRIPLYRRVVHPELPGLYFIGLVQPLGAIMPIAEAQSEWVADVLEGKADAARSGAHAPGDRARGRADGQALRRLQAPHDPGRLHALHADARSASGGAGRWRGCARRARTRRSPPPAADGEAAGREGAARCPLCGGRAYPWIGVPHRETGATVGLASPVDPDDPATGERARLINRCEDCGSGIEQGPRSTWPRSSRRSRPQPRTASAR